MGAIAKTGREDPAIRRSLIGHSLDVAYVAREMLKRGVSRSRLSTLAGFDLTPIHVERLAYFIGLHDFGKACHHFQNKIAGRAGTVWGSHLTEAFAGMMVPAVADQFALVKRWFVPGQWSEILQVLIGHHGGPIAASDLKASFPDKDALWLPADGCDPVGEVADLFAALNVAFPLAVLGGAAGDPFPGKGRFAHALAGLVQAADKRASDEGWVPLDRPDDDPDIAVEWMNQLSWGGWGERRTPIVENPRPLQQAMMDIPLEQVVTIEAPTGDGKTEAAVIWAARLVEAGLVDGLFLAGPLRSATTCLEWRLIEIFKSAYQNLAWLVCNTSHYGNNSAPSTVPQTSLTIGFQPSMLAYPVIVGTIDQAMLSVLRARHAWMRGWLISRHLLVIDEAHASDAYMSAIIAELVDRHVARGGYVLLMSATLGAGMSDRILKRTDRLGLEEAENRPYPLISTASGSLHPVDPARQKTVLPRVASRADCIARATKMVEDQGSVLWICSTIEEAVRTYAEIRAIHSCVMLHHSRFHEVDRNDKDSTLINEFGPDSHRRRAMIVVATQTCEQSLDIDMDLLVTDACPADVLLQRCGRAGRHRPRYQAEVLILDPTEMAGWDAYLTEDGKPLGLAQGWGWVYDPLSVRATIDMVRLMARLVVPQDVRRLVEGATHPQALREAAEQFGGRWVSAWERTRSRAAHNAMIAQSKLIDEDQPYAEAVTLDDIGTRMGDFPVVFEINNDRMFASGRRIHLDEIAIPYKWVRGQFTNDADVSYANVLWRTLIWIAQGGNALELCYDEYGLQRVDDLKKWNLWDEM